MVEAQAVNRSAWDRIALVLQGGGALGAYQAGVYEALHEAGLEPDWVAGTSIGGINGAIIAGNRLEDRVKRLRQFWESVTSRDIGWFGPPGTESQKLRDLWSAWTTLLFGQPGFFTVNVPNPWFSLPGWPTATSFYDRAPLREALTRLVDFDLLNKPPTRYACGTVNVETGNFAYFDTDQTRITLDHVLASGALPPALPMVEIGEQYFWDGGLVSNTPLQWVLENTTAQSLLVFQVDLFPAAGKLPRDMYDVLDRVKDIQYSSRTRMVTDYFHTRHERSMVMKQLLEKVPENVLTDQERALKQQLAMLPAVGILLLIYQQAVYEGQAKDYEFSTESMHKHWAAGLRDTRETLKRRDWLESTPGDNGIVVHDIHHPDAA